jgi:cysteine desulfurase
LSVVTAPEVPVYLDHAATTPVRSEAVEAFLEAVTTVGNPSSSHAAGREARRLLEDAREVVAAAVGADPAEVLLTSGGTEADNLAVKGTFWARRAADPRRTRIVVSAVEHHAVLDAARWLGEQQGADVVELAVDAEGVVDLDALEDELRRHADRIALVSVMWANNEVGALQPVREVAAAAAAHGIPVHSDAVQAVGHVHVDFRATALAALSLSGHKLGAPVGTGALVARRDLGLVPVQHGGGQERGVRSGTLAAAPGKALAAAVRSAVAALPQEGERLSALRDRLLAGVTGSVDDVVPHGPPPGPGRLPGSVHVTVAGADAEVLLYLLDAGGVAASSGSACQAGVEQVSHVLSAMGVAEGLARGALRFTLGHTSTKADVDALLRLWPEVVARARRAKAAS